MSDRPPNCPSAIRDSCVVGLVRAEAVLDSLDESLAVIRENIEAAIPGHTEADPAGPAPPDDHPSRDWTEAAERHQDLMEALGRIRRALVRAEVDG